MKAEAQSRRVWKLTIRRYVEIAWSGHAPTRFATVIVVPILVMFAVPGWWWALVALGTAVAMIIDFLSRDAFIRLADSLDDLDDRALVGLIRRHVLVIAAITAAYVAPYGLLALAPSLGPVIGLVFCAGAAVVCASLHVMTRTMIFYTAPVVMVSLIANAAAMAPGWHGLISAVLAAVVALNAVVTARAGAANFSELITARLRAEEAAEGLERRVAERTAQLGVATQRAQAANRAKSVFLANMSHELRTPLNAIIGYSEIVQEDMEAGELATSVSDLAKIRGAATHLLSLITEVLDLSRIEAGKLNLRSSHVGLAPLLNEVLETVRPIALKSDTALHLTVQPGAERVFADETRVRQCLLNLLSNAAKFTHAGEVAIEARTCRIGAAPGVAVIVRDTGCGIAPGDLDKLFQPFVQADNTNTRAHDGAGLGLVITRRLARAMGGEVTATSQLGRGSQFILYLPTAPQARAAA